MLFTVLQSSQGRQNMDKNMPKFAIANNFAIGSLPHYLSNLLTDVTSPLLSPIRLFVFVMLYYGGAHKSITGSYSFFNQDVEKNVGTLGNQIKCFQDN